MLLFFINHPAQFHLFKHTIRYFLTEGMSCKIIIVSKDILEELVLREKWDYENIFPEGRRAKKNTLLSVIQFAIETEKRLIKVIKESRPRLLIGTEGTLAHVGLWCGIKTLLVNEDDTSVNAWNFLTYPFATKVVMPECCDPHRWKRKRISYQGLHEVAYLHPNYFQPDRAVVEKYIRPDMPYYILRLVSLTASHDHGKKGLEDKQLIRLMGLLKAFGNVYITSERPLKEEFQSYLLPVPVEEIHHAMAFCDMFIGDSQTMAAEAAVLGVPSIRYNDFAGKLNYLEMLEHQYQLTFGFKTSEFEMMMNKIKDLLQNKDETDSMEQRHKQLLLDMVDVTAFLIQTVRKYL
ncbi:MAG: DUF354 domain-containing protein [Candidatus Omnitrophica bacterium]|nr:DUF354 domain-containing protein [Candidatus Omnitrophota bacterium]